jgi:hypothetical protein
MKAFCMFDENQINYKVRGRQKFQKTRLNWDVRMGYMKDETGFMCCHCHYYVSSLTILSGVNNRNHCPYCLWSRHLDLYKAGDRMAACKESMDPVGLTYKRSRKKYARAKKGELMIIHCCTVCGKIDINRIAADDDVEILFELYERSLELGSNMLTRLVENGIDILKIDDLAYVQNQLRSKCI